MSTCGAPLPRRGALLRLAVLVAATCLPLAPAVLAAPALAFVSEQFLYLDEYDAARDLLDAGFEVGV